VSAWPVLGAGLGEPAVKVVVWAGVDTGVAVGATIGVDVETGVGVGTGDGVVAVALVDCVTVRFFFFAVVVGALAMAWLAPLS
jgi:hypothetical protein